MGVNAPILSTLSLKLLLYTALFFLWMLSVTSKWANSPVCVCLCMCAPWPLGIGSLYRKKVNREGAAATVNYNRLFASFFSSLYQSYFSLTCFLIIDTASLWLSSLLSTKVKALQLDALEIANAQAHTCKRNGGGGKSKSMLLWPKEGKHQGRVGGRIVGVHTYMPSSLHPSISVHVYFPLGLSLKKKEEEEKKKKKKDKSHNWGHLASVTSFRAYNQSFN